LALQPDLVVTFSDLQAEIVASLIREGVQVHAFYQQSVAGILDMVRMVGAIVGKPEAGTHLAKQLSVGLEAIRTEAQQLSRRPRVCFEEWDEPMISAIGWVSEIMETVGGVDVFADRATGKSAKNRIVSAEQVIAATPTSSLGHGAGSASARNVFAAGPALMASLP
jgi:iron complex transport system substrate-binding protein